MDEPKDIHNFSSETNPAAKTIDLSTDDDQLHVRLDFKTSVKYFFLRNIVMCIGKLSAVVPERWTYRTGVALAMMVYRRLPRLRKLARKHLEIAFGGEKPPEEIDEILRLTYVNYGKSFAEFLMVPHKSKEWIESKVVMEDPEWYTRTAMNEGKGVIGLGAHFGSWELVNARIAIYKYPAVGVVKAQRDTLISKFIMDTRTKWGNEYIFRVKGVKEECIKQLALNKIVGLVADQNAARNGVFIDFFGKKAATFTGPAYFAMKTGAPILASFPYRNPDNTITLLVQPPLEIRDTGNFEEDLLYNVQLCATLIEKFVRQHPTEYFWWHKRWKTRPEDE
ncbi:lysophospholipid acyltransferase family protein [bacterium]